MKRQNDTNTLRDRLVAFLSRHWAEEKRTLKIHIEDMKYKGQHVVALLFITIFCFIVIRREYNFCELAKYGKTTKAVIVCFHEYTEPMGVVLKRTIMQYMSITLTALPMPAKYWQKNTNSMIL